MTNRVQTFRSSVTTNLPAAGTRLPGEIWVNFPDKQFGTIDTSKNAQKLLAVRFFVSTATYVASDMVTQAGAIYVATGAISPGAFNAGQWTKIAAITDIPAPYVLPTASTTVLGGVKVDGVTVLIDGSGKISSVGTIFIGAAPPGAPATGSLWWDSLGGQLYVYYDDGSSKQWVIAVNENLAANYLALSGGVMSGNLSITNAAPAIGLNKTITGNSTTIGGYNNGSQRWGLQLGEGTAESGSSAGSDFTLNSCDDTGTYNYTVMRALRADGSVNFPQTVNAASVQAGALSSSGNILGGAGLYPNYGAASDFYLTAIYTDRILYWASSGGYYEYHHSATGMHYWIGANAVGMNLDYTGNLGVAGNFNGPGTNTLNYISAQNGAVAGNWSVSGTMTASYVTCNSTCTVSGALNAASTVNAAQFYASSSLGVNYAAWSGSWLALNVSGNGMFVNLSGTNYGSIILDSYSDERIKNVLGPSLYGLKEILATEPIIYTYKGNHAALQPSADAAAHELENVEPVAPDTTTVHVGIIAQKQEKIIPEMIEIREGFIDGKPVDDLRGFVYHEWITYALVNAVKEMAARIEALEAMVVP